MTLLPFLLLAILNVCLAQIPQFTTYEVCPPPTDPDTGMLWKINYMQPIDFGKAFSHLQFLNPGNRTIQRIDYVDDYTPFEANVCADNSNLDFPCVNFFRDKEGRFFETLPLKMTEYDPVHSRQYGEVQRVYLIVALTTGEIFNYTYGNCDETGRLAFYAEPWPAPITTDATTSTSTATETSTAPEPTTTVESTTVGPTSAGNSTVPYTSSTIVSTGTSSGEITSVTRAGSSTSTVTSIPTGPTSGLDSKSVPATSTAGDSVASSAVSSTGVPATGAGSNTSPPPAHGTSSQLSLPTTSEVLTAASSALCPCAIQTATGGSSAVIVRTVTRVDLCPCAAQTGGQCACRSQALQSITEYVSAEPRATGIPNSAYCPCLAQSGSSGQGGGSDYDQGAAHPGGSGGVEQVGSASNTVTVAIIPMILLGLVALS